MKSKIKGILLLFFVAVLGLNTVGCSEKKAEPILNVITSTDKGGISVLSSRKYYTVYDNGKSETTSEFTPSNIECYTFSSKDSSEALSGVDLNTEEGTNLNEIGKNIISLSKDEKTFKSLEWIYVIDNKYYFTVWLDKGWFYTYTALYQYNETDNCIEKIATFKGNITHIEPYEESD